MSIRIPTLIEKHPKRRLAVLIVLFLLTTICLTPLMLFANPLLVLSLIGLTTTGWTLYVVIRYHHFFSSRRGWSLTALLFTLTLIAYDILDPIYDRTITTATLIVNEAFALIILLLMFAAWIFFVSLFVNSLIVFFRHHRLLGTWPGFCLIAMLFLATTLWLRSHSYLIETTDQASSSNLAIAVYLLLLMFLFAIGAYISSFILLWRQVDAGILLFLIISSANGVYLLALTNQFDKLEDAFQVTGDLFLWGLPMVWALPMSFISGLVFLFRFGQLVVKEVVGE